MVPEVTALVEAGRELSAVETKRNKETCENTCAHKQEAALAGRARCRGTEGALTGEDVGVSVLLLVVVLAGLLVRAGGRAARKKLREGKRGRRNERANQKTKEKRIKQQQTRWSVKTTECTGCKGGGTSAALPPPSKGFGLLQVTH